jgi:hypothetical protein
MWSVPYLAIQYSDLQGLKQFARGIAMANFLKSFSGIEPTLVD